MGFEAPNVASMDLSASGSTATAAAVATGSWSDLIGANPKRRFVVVAVPIDEADPLLLSLADAIGKAGSGAILYLAPGEKVVLSMSGDMPWQGAIYAQGYGAASSCIWAEVEDAYVR